ncbi:hypothetical protein BN2905_00890 [Achromobacter xylosoxidans]|nr:hypothetical protein BN2905_00890 [Achromobacter xylosoxidans]
MRAVNGGNNYWPFNANGSELCHGDSNQGVQLGKNALHVDQFRSTLGPRTPPNSGGNLLAHCVLDVFTANARALATNQPAGTGPLDLVVWTARQTGGGATVLNPQKLADTASAIMTGATSGYATNLFIGRAVGGNGQELRPVNAAYHRESMPDVRLTANARTLATRQAQQVQSHSTQAWPWRRRRLVRARPEFLRAVWLRHHGLSGAQKHDR